jgi:hypothetical protein
MLGHKLARMHLGETAIAMTYIHLLLQIAVVGQFHASALAKLHKFWHFL